MSGCDKCSQPKPTRLVDRITCGELTDLVHAIVEQAQKEPCEGWSVMEECQRTATMFVDKMEAPNNNQLASIRDTSDFECKKQPKRESEWDPLPSHKFTGVIIQMHRVCKHCGHIERDGRRVEGMSNG